MINILYIPYRDLYFWHEFGSAVRDLQFLEIFSRFESVKDITVLNRPVSVYERILNKRVKINNYPDINVIDKTSFDLFGPLKKRAWTVNCYTDNVNDYINDYLKDPKALPLLVIDFTPMALIPVIKDKKVYYWYDMIDNFTKHNCYSQLDKKLVDDKYKYVAEYYNFMTSVTIEASKAITRYSKIESAVISNGVFTSRFSDKISKSISDNHIYDFGFVGFITDKFDVNFVQKLVKNHSVIIYGEAYNKSVVEELSKLGVVFHGKFNYSELPQLISTFKIGLLPYLAERSHDGSPLKMYEYIKNDKPCLTSIDYEFSCEYVVNYNSTNDLNENIKRLIECSGNSNIHETLPVDSFLKHKISSVFDLFIKRIN
ncbi:hypothetical protein C3432_02350 [Citrobacter amalonaticus]|uniref:Glycosyltransferase n=1 Tax=Citrobacter amalonaticus TaxID=35703 RepID=A0A2S4S2S3_CITAM|nr:hypothetical protein [Citrobacter amalonaticus]POT59584.1 hypothetical protein C3432_02350 [Citrobacter amalonaticus]POT77714.1 hypothetical protein C3436_10020 [Citrobacter amalonaticus]POU68166.1 hypothetical protein C3430_03555 [Citrobacter amalonaticus]POV07770.1 hypothetical protein C3424_03565 [Citrobacter amalonaticus]